MSVVTSTRSSSVGRHGVGPAVAAGAEAADDLADAGRVAAVDAHAAGAGGGESPDALRVGELAAEVVDGVAELAEDEHLVARVLCS